MKFFKDFAYPVIILCVLCLVVTVGLVATHNLTQPIIDKQAGSAEDAARIELLPEAEGFEKMELSADITENKWFEEAYQATNGVGYVFTTTTSGFAGPIHIMTAIDSNGKIVNVKMTDEHSETAGYGTRAAQPEYYAQYVGKDETLEGVKPNSGASTTTKGFESAVKYAFDIYYSVTGGKK